MIIGKQFDKSLTSVDEPIPDISVDPNAVIRTAEVISGLKSIASRYTSDLKKQARAYAEEKVASALDGDTDFYSQAKDSLDEIYGAKREKATSDYAERSKELSQQKGEIGNRRASAIWRVSDRYDVKEGKLAEKLSKNGLNHSTIADLAKADLKEKRAREIARVGEIYDKRVEALDNKIDRLTSSYELALKNYEIAYAVQLERDIAKLQSKRDKMEEEYKKEHADDKDKAIAEYLENDRKENAEFEDCEGDYTGAKKENYTERYNYLVEQLSGKTAKSVANFIKNNEATLKEYLGLYYDDFVKEVT